MSTQVIFTQAYNPGLVLGQNNWITEVNQAQKDPRDLLHDIKITYYCDQTWDVAANLEPTVYAKTIGKGNTEKIDPWKARLVEDFRTCQLKYPGVIMDEKAMN